MGSVNIDFQSGRISGMPLMSAPVGVALPEPTDIRAVAETAQVELDVVGEFVRDDT